MRGGVRCFCRVSRVAARCARTAAGKGPAGWLDLVWRSTGNPAELAGFRQALKEFGYIEGQNLIVDCRFGEGRDERIPDLAAELIQLRPDAVVALGGLAISALKNLTTVIPVVSMTGDPVGLGLVASLARPGGNITGVSMMQGAEGLTGKRVELLKDALPAAARIGLLFNPDVLISSMDLAQAGQVASRLGLVLRPFPMRRGEEIEAAIAALSREGVDRLHIPPQFPFTSLAPAACTWSRRPRTQSGCIGRAPPPDSPPTMIQEIGALLS